MKIITLTAIVAVLVAVIFAGCVDKEEATPITNRAFKNMSADAFDDTADQLEKVKLAIDNNNIARAELELATFETMIDTYIDDFKQTKVSVDAIPFKQQILAFFDEMKLSSTHCEKYLATSDENEWMLFLEHIANAMAHGSMAAKLGENI